MKTVFLAVVGLLLAPMSCQTAAAHHQGVDGGPMPAWIEAQCCGASDAHYLTPDQVHVTPDGDKLDGYAGVIREDRLLPSPDGSWWVFHRTYDDGTQSTVYCLFGPESQS